MSCSLAAILFLRGLECDRYPRVQANVADQALGVGETAHIADRRRHTGSNDQVDAGDREQPLD
jgi:hypothetical protein